MEKFIIIAAILGVLILGILGGVDPSVPSLLKNGEPDPFAEALE